MTDQDSPDFPGPYPQQSINITRCVELHDSIAAFHLNSTNLHRRCRLRKDFWAVHTEPENFEIRGRLTDDLNSFLSAISVFVIEDETVAEEQVTTPNAADIERPPKKPRLEPRPRQPSFTPSLHFPYPWLMFQYEEWPVDDENDEAVLESTVVLLYSSTVTKGGLFFDMSTNLCCWASVEGPSWPQRPDEWIKLETALERYLYCWEVGRYTVGGASSEDGSDNVRPYAEKQMVQTLIAWEALLEAIEIRMPEAVTSGHIEESRSDPSDQETPEVRYLLSKEDAEDMTLLRELNLIAPVAESEEQRLKQEDDPTPCFLLQFLSQARRPNLENFRIAPGITYFKASIVRSAQAADRERREAAFDQRGDMNEWHEWPFLLFPYVGLDGQEKISDWARWQGAGYEDLLLDRRAGLYCVSEVYAGWFDGVKFFSRRPLELTKDDVHVEIAQDVPGHNLDDEVALEKASELHLTLAIRCDEHGSAVDDSEQAEEDNQSGSEQGSEGPTEIVSQRGNDILFCHSNFYHCPYFERHNPRLMDVLVVWRKLVENGVVAVGPDGVEGTMEEVWEEAKRYGQGVLDFDMGRCW